MKVAVIGAGGFLGRALVRTLEAAGSMVLPISTAAPHAFDPHSGRLSDDLPIDRGLGAVVYLSQSPRYRDLPQSIPHLWAVNVVSALTAAEWARRCGARRFLYTSSGNVYRPGFDAYTEASPVRRDDWYALSKLHAEEALGRYEGDLDVTCLRLFAVYGPGQHGKLVPNLADAVRHGRPITLQPHPTNAADTDGLKLSLTYVDDAARVLADLATRPGPATLNVAGCDATSVREIANAIGRRLNRAPRFETGEVLRSGDLIADTSRLAVIWPHPRTTVEAGLDRTIAAMRVSTETGAEFG